MEPIHPVIPCGFPVLFRVESFAFSLLPYPLSGSAFLAVSLPRKSTFLGTHRACRVHQRLVYVRKRKVSPESPAVLFDIPSSQDTIARTFLSVGTSSFHLHRLTEILSFTVFRSPFPTILCPWNDRGYHSSRLSRFCTQVSDCSSTSHLVGSGGIFPVPFFGELFLWRFHVALCHVYTSKYTVYSCD